MPKPAARVSDMTQHGGVIMPPGALKTMIEMLPAARVTDLHTCPMVTGVVPHVGGPIIMGSFTVFIEFLPAARVMDQLICVGPPDMIAKGAAKTFIGDPMGGATTTMAPPSAPGGAGGGPYHYTVGPLGEMSSPDGAPLRKCTKAGDPVDVATGRVFTEAEDFAVPGVPGLTATRLYSTSLAPQDSAWGFGWTSRFDERLEVRPEMIVYHSCEGRRILFPPIPPEEEYLFHLDEQIMLRRRPGGYFLEDPSGRRLAFETSPTQPAVAWLTQIADGAARRVEIERTAGGLIQRVRDTLGGEWLFDAQPGPTARIAAVRHRAPGQATDAVILRLTYDQHGNLATAQDALGYTARYQYDPGHRLVQRTDRNGYSFSFQYDRWNRCIRTWGQDGLFDLAFFYSEDEPLTTVRDSLGRTTLYYHNALGLVTRVVDAQGRQELFAYQGTNLVKHTDTLGRVTEYRYDKYGQVTGRKSPGGGETTVDIAPDGSATSADAEGNVLVRRRGDDGAMRIGLAGEPAPWATESVDPLAGSVTRRDGLGHESQFFFNPAGRPIRSVLPLGQTYQYQYDALGRRTAILPPAGASVHFSYDPLGRLTTVAREGGSAFQFRYDGEGNLCTTVDGNGRATRREYAGFHQLAAVTDSLGQTVRYEYDLANRLCKITDARAAATSFDYDTLGRVQRILYPDGRSEVAGFDPAGQLRRFQDRGGVGSDWTHDADGHPTAIRYADGTAFAFSYDRDGRLTGARSADADVAFTYDGYGRLASETQNGRTVAYTYDSAGRLAGLTHPGGEQARYDYDPNGRLSEVTDRNGGVHAFQYADAGPVREHRFPSGLIAETTLTPLGLPETVRLGRGRDLVAQRRLRHDGNDAVTEIVDSGLGRVSFRYDAVGRVQAVQHDTDTLSESFTYDPAGNVTGRGGPGDFRYDSCNQFQGGPGVRCRHDARGHAIALEEDGRGPLRLSYDGPGRLTRAVLPDGTAAEYAYDPFGRRLRKRCHGTETHYLWAGHQLIGETTRDADGREIERRDYLYHPGSFTPLAMRLNGASYDFHCDHRGAPIRVSDAAGTLVWTADYSAFGEARVRGARIEQNLRFPGQYFDAETGLHYNRARYYTPRWGRYLSPDPLGLAGGLNLYAYADNDPINRVDPLGRTGKRPASPSSVGADAGNDAKKSRANDPAPSQPNTPPLNPVASTDTTPQVGLLPPPAPAQGTGNCGGANGAQPVQASNNTAVPNGIADPNGGPKKIRTYQDSGKIDPCFVPGTLVKTPAGEQKIETLVPGDAVLSYDFEKGEASVSHVVHVCKNWTNELIDVCIGTDTITSTRGHLYWVADQAVWMPASKLQEGRTLHQHSQQPCLIRAANAHHRTSVTYNIEVAHTHNYFVGASGVLVHNGKGKPSSFSLSTKQPSRIYTITDVRTNQVIYVGKTVQGQSAEARFQQHLALKPEWEKNEAFLRPLVVAEGDWTPYETAVWEQHMIDKFGGLNKVNPVSKLENKIPAINAKKYKLYQEGYGHNPCP